MRSGERYMAGLIASVRAHKRNFWNYAGQYQRAETAPDKQWLKDLAMCEWRLMKLNFSYAKEFCAGSDNRANLEAENGPRS